MIYTTKDRLKTRKPSDTECNLIGELNNKKMPVWMKYIIIFGTAVCAVPMLSMAIMHEPLIATLLPLIPLSVLYIVIFSIYFIKQYILNKEYSKENIRVVRAICSNKRKIKNASKKDTDNGDVIRYTFFTEYNDIYQIINPLIFGSISKDDNCVIVFTRGSNILILKSNIERQGEIF